MIADRPALPASNEPALADAASPPTALHAPAAIAISSDALFAGAREVQIAHRGSIYRLRQTALGKLILTK